MHDPNWTACTLQKDKLVLDLKDGEVQSGLFMKIFGSFEAAQVSSFSPNVLF